MRINPLILILLSPPMLLGAQNPAVIASEFVFDAAPYASCHASTIAQNSGGELLAAWFGGSAEGNPDVCIFISRSEGGHWIPGVKVADGVQADGRRYACWNPVLFQSRKGPLLLFYKVGPSPELWWGMLMASPDGGRSWGRPRRLPEGVLGPTKNKPIELADGTLLCGSSIESPGRRVWRVHLELSTDLGATWRLVGPLDGGDRFNSIQPCVLTHKNGSLQLLCRSREMVITTSWSSDQGRSWSPLESSGLYSPNSGCDAVTLADGRQLLVYNYRDHPRVDAAGAIGDWGVRWPLNVSLSRNGVQWEMLLALESEPCRDGYAYPSVIQTRDGLVHVTYTWNRKRIKHVTIDPSRL